MDANNVEVTITVTINGTSITKSATAGSTGNPYRLAENVVNSVAGEANNEMHHARFGWDQAAKKARR
ncbi:hypothetical protein [Micromonospora sp. NBC_00421]|uniref:hypothetical protein n=1 Tax=Micromonospora sp. NBC_00421 TaxID=2975976 RepID=UPI002E2447F8